jgi:hypothetical protein
LSETELLPLAASLERSSEHPLAAAIVAAARDRSLALKDPTDFTSITGKGVTGSVDGRAVALGSGCMCVMAASGVVASRSALAWSGISLPEVRPSGMADTSCSAAFRGRLSSSDAAALTFSCLPSVVVIKHLTRSRSDRQSRRGSERSEAAERGQVATKPRSA